MMIVYNEFSFSIINKKLYKIGNYLELSNTGFSPEIATQE